jgi:undecaprenyl-diphosphatase
MGMKYDYVSLYNKNAAFYNARPKAKKALKTANDLLSYAFFAAYILLGIYAIIQKDFPTRDYLRLFLPPAIVLIAATLFRWAICRPRPYSPEGAGIESLVKKKNGTDSCPSRHLACAAVIAVTLLPIFPIFGVGLALLCPCLAYTRFALGLHYPSDLLFGMGLGGSVGMLVFLL